MLEFVGLLKVHVLQVIFKTIILKRVFDFIVETPNFYFGFILFLFVLVFFFLFPNVHVLLKVWNAFFIYFFSD